MNPTGILLPVAALAVWTLAVLLLIPYRRFTAVLSRQVHINEFKLGESQKVPPEVSIPNRNMMNLLELPVLFYVACLTLFVVKGADPGYLGLAWAYVVLRVAHSAVHLTYNRVMHRMYFFAASNLVLTVIWLRLLLLLG